jgi:hypothetical protein
VLHAWKATTPSARRGRGAGRRRRGGATRARRQRTVPAPGRPSPRLAPCPVWRRAGAPSPTHDPVASARGVGLRGTAQAPAAREATGTGPRSRGRGGQGVGGRPRSADVGEQGDTWTRPSPGGPCRWDLQQGPRAQALPWEPRSPGLVTVVETVEPRATSAEEPDAGNPLVRSWRGAGTGNLPAYSTKPFSPPWPHVPLVATLPPAALAATPSTA